MLCSVPQVWCTGMMDTCWFQLFEDEALIFGNTGQQCEQCNHREVSTKTLKPSKNVKIAHVFKQKLVKASILFLPARNGKMKRYTG